MILVEFTDRQLVEVARDELYELICAGKISALLVEEGWLEIPRAGSRRDGGAASTNTVCTWPNLFSPAQLAEQIVSLKHQLKEKEAAIAELERALAENEGLDGIITICANCKKIRDVDDEWVNPEKYIQDHTRARFSHGICRTCVSKLYPDSYSIEEK